MAHPERLLPIERNKRGRGRPPDQSRLIISDILWRLRCGAPWRNVSPQYGSWNTFIGGSGGGARPGAGRSWRRRQPRSWRTLAITASTAAPSVPTFRQRAKKGRGHRRALGRSRGGFTSKLHCLADALGRPLAFHLTGGEAADCEAYDARSLCQNAHPMPCSPTRATMPTRFVPTLLNGRSNPLSPAGQTDG
ncbi:transposase [Sphingomonas insulae]|uniref:transposase n=1 Tax=Sphingomonas insulae TaxID=424800 RepID=UPI0013D23A50